MCFNYPNGMNYGGAPGGGEPDPAAYDARRYLFLENVLDIDVNGGHYGPAVDRRFDHAL